jgi:hypothetical protein
MSQRDDLLCAARDYIIRRGRLIRRAVTKSGRKLVAEAGDAGLPVIEAEARQAERWLVAVEAVNRQVMPRHPVARQLGWQADAKTFVTGHDASWRVEPRYANQAAALAARRPDGTLACWKDAIGAASSGWPNKIPWRAVVVSTGEQPATSFTTHQGASPRVLSICSPPFGTDGQASCAVAEAVEQGVEAHYGTAGPAFVARLQARLEEDSGPELPALTRALRQPLHAQAQRAGNSVQVGEDEEEAEPDRLGVGQRIHPRRCTTTGSARHRRRRLGVVERVRRGRRTAPSRARRCRSRWPPRRRPSPPESPPSRS